MNGLRRTIVALDGMNEKECFNFLETKAKNIPWVKIGMELFYQYGHNIVNKIAQEYKKNIFLDLKLHDIPVTVEKAIASLKSLPVHFLTIHLHGGEEMLQAAKSPQKINLPETKLLGVTYLTSLSENQIQTFFGNNRIDFLIKMAMKTQIDGLIMSGHELKIADQVDPERKLLRVCPGIKFSEDMGIANDQARVYSPEMAFSSGANYLVIGRGLTQSTQTENRIKFLNSLSVND